MYCARWRLFSRVAEVTTSTGGEAIFVFDRNVFCHESEHNSIKNIESSPVEWVPLGQFNRARSRNKNFLKPNIFYCLLYCGLVVFCAFHHVAFRAYGGM